MLEEGEEEEKEEEQQQQLLLKSVKYASQEITSLRKLNMGISTSVNFSYKNNLTLKNKSKSLFMYITQHGKGSNRKVEIQSVSYIVFARISKN